MTFIIGFIVFVASAIAVVLDFPTIAAAFAVAYGAYVVVRLARWGTEVFEIGTTRARNGAANAAQNGADYDPRASRF